MRLTLVFLLLVVSPTVANADSIKINRELLDADGNPVLYAQNETSGDLTGLHWLICRPGEACTEGGEGDGRSFEPGPEPAGTRFKAVLPSGEATSDPWGGRVAELKPPILDTQPQVGAALSVTPGSWSGGWGAEYDEVRIEACRKPSGIECLVIYAPSENIYRRHFAVPAKYTGWYLMASALHRASGETIGGTGHGTPESVAPWSPTPLVAHSTLVGPVVNPYVRPSIRLPRTTRRRLGVLSCPGHCSLRLVVRRGERRWVVQRRVIGSRRLSLPRGARHRGSVQVAVYVNGALIAKRLVRVTP